MNTFINYAIAISFFILLVLYMVYLICKYIVSSKTNRKNKLAAYKVMGVITHITFILIGVILIGMSYIAYKEFKLI